MRAGGIKSQQAQSIGAGEPFVGARFELAVAWPADTAGCVNVGMAMS